MGELRKHLGRLFPSPGHLSLLGFAIPQIWMYTIAQKGSGLGNEALAAYHIASICTLLATAAVFLRYPGRPAPRATAIASALGMALLPLYLAFAPTAGVWSLTCAAAGGAGSAWCFLAWFKACCDTGQDRDIAYLLLSFGLAALIRLILALMPPWAASVALAALSASFAALLPYAERLARKPGPSIAAAEAAMRPRSSYSARRKALVLLELALYSFVLGLMSPATSESQSHIAALALNYALRIVFVLVLFVWLTLHGKRREVVPFVQATFCGTVVAMLALTLLGNSAPIVAAGLLSFARSIVLVLLTIVAAEIAETQRLHPIAVFGVGRAVYEAAVLVGMLLTWLPSWGSTPVTASLNVVFFVVSCLLLTVGTRTVKTMAHIGSGESSGGDIPTRPGATGPEAGAGISERCRDLAANHGLTARETDVLALLCQGRGKAHIAATLSISENTVRHHSKNIYAKLAVHSREELMDLLDKA